MNTGKGKDLIKAGDSRILRFVPYLVLAVLVEAFFGEVAFSRHVFFWRDNFQSCAWVPFTGSMLEPRTWLRLWNPFEAGGKPYFADPQTVMLLYPFNYLYWVLSPVRAMVVAIMLQLFIMGASMYALCRHWLLGQSPSMLAAVCLMFGTLTISNMDSKEIFEAMSWVPLVLLLISLLIERWHAGGGSHPWGLLLWRNIHLIIALALVIAMQYLAGYPQALLNGLLMTGLYAVARACWQGGVRLVPAAMVCLGLACVAAAGLVMVQLLPSLEVIGLTDRAANIDPLQGMASMHPLHLLTLALPYLFGTAGYPREYWAKTIFEFWLGTCYIGVLPLVFLFLSPLTVWKKIPVPRIHRFLFWFFLGLAVFSLLMAAGRYTPVYMLFYKIVPGFSHFRWPTKFLQILVYSLTVFAALGMNALMELRRNDPAAGRRVMLVVRLVLLILLALGVAGYYSTFRTPALINFLTGGSFIDTPAHRVMETRDIGCFLIFLALATGALGLLAARRLPAAWFVCAGILVTFANLWIVSRSIYPVTTDDVYESAPDLDPFRSAMSDQLLVFSRYKETPQFLYGNGDSGKAEWLKAAAGSAILYQYGVSCFDQWGLKLSRWSRLSNLYKRLPPSQTERIADIMSVGYALNGTDSGKVLWENAPGKMMIWHRPTSLPRAYLVSGWEIIRNPDQVLKRLLSPAFDPRTSAIVEPGNDSPTPPGAGNNRLQKPGGVIGPIRHTWDSAEVDAKAGQRSMLVTTETWFPGWKVFVDGKPAPVYRVNYNYRGVILDAGEHHVLYKYMPWQLKAGAAVSVFTLFAMLILTAVRAGGLIHRKSSPVPGI